MTQGNAGTEIEHVHATIGSPLRRNFVGPKQVVETFCDRYRTLSMDSMDTACLESWREFSNNNPSTRFAFYNGDILVTYDGAIGVLNLALTRPSEETARKLAEEYALPLADENQAQKMIDEFTEREQQAQKMTDEFTEREQQTLGGEELVRDIAQEIRLGLAMSIVYSGLRRAAELFPEAKFGLVDGRIFLQIKEGQVGEMTPAPEDGIPTEQLRKILQKISTTFEKVIFVEGNEATPLQESFEAQETPINLPEIFTGTMLAKAVQEMPGGLFVPQIGGLVGYFAGDDEQPRVAKWDRPGWETEEESRAFCVKYGIPIAEGEEAEKILRLYQERREEPADEGAEQPAFG